MKTYQGITNVPSAGTAVQMKNVPIRVKYVIFKALAGNSGLAYVGDSGVSASNGFELSAGNTVELNLGETGGSVPAYTFYADTASNNDKVCWFMIAEG